jgi:probable rRNA maturation factor
MIEVELFGSAGMPGAPTLAETRRLCRATAAARGVHEGHVAVELVDSARIAQLNREHRGKADPTDVLSFPIDGELAASEGRVNGAAAVDDLSAEGGHDVGVPVELGDIVICPEQTTDLREAVVHGMLHLLGMDHETDSGEMLALQAEILRWVDE